LSNPTIRVDIAPGEQHPPQRGASVIGREARRKHQAEAAARARQRDRPLDEQLIAVGVAVRLRVVDARVAREAQDRRQVGAGARARAGRPRVGANHVPWRIAEHRVEAGARQARAVAIEEDLPETRAPSETGGAPGRRPPPPRDTGRRFSPEAHCAR
jgi:hypothetical protein